MNRSIMNRRIIVITMVCIMLVSMCGSTCSVFANTTISKDETVYVVTNSDGSVNDVIVSDHLVNDSKASIINDISDLKNIENVKGDEKFIQNDNKIEWSADGNDIFYQGRTDKELPVKMNVSYFMSGEEFTGEEMQGRKGDFIIKIEYQNTNNVPFIIMSGILVQNDHYSNITVNNGKTLDDGEKTIVLGLASSGLIEKLNGKVKEKIAQAGLGSEIVISGCTDSFDITDIMTLATNQVFDDIDTSELANLDFDDDIDKLDNGAKALNDGSKELYNGLNLLNENAPALADGVSQLNGGAVKLSAGMKSLKAGADTLSAGQKAVADGVEKVYAGITGTDETPGLNESLQSVSDGITKLSDGVSNLVDNSNSVLSDADGALDSVIASLTELKVNKTIDEDTYNELVGTLTGAKKGIGTAKAINSSSPSESLPTGGIKQTVNGAGENLKNGVGQIQNGVITLTGAFDGTPDNPGLLAGVDSITGGLTQLSSQVGDEKDDGTLSNGAAQLAQGLSQMNSKTVPLVEGINKLTDGSCILSKGMTQLYNEGIEKLVDMYKDDLKGLTSGIDETIDAGKSYRTFSKLSDEMNGSVKFIYKTSVKSV